MTNQEIIFYLITFIILNLISLLGAKKLSLKLKIIIFLLSCLIYIPIVLTSLFVIALSGIDASCKFLDMNCLRHKPDDLKFEIWMIIINISFIVTLIINFIHILMKIIKNNYQKIYN